MKEASMSPVMMNALVSEPASSLTELEKVFEIAVKGSDDEKIAAATILCGASLIRGWNVQEHSCYFITRLLSPPPPANYSGNDSHLIAYAPMLNVLLLGIAPIDCVQIFCLHGLVPQLAGSLMTICEVFGSYVPNISWTLTTEEEISAHAMFSNAFSLLLKLWRFNPPPLEYGVGDVPPAAFVPSFESALDTELFYKWLHMNISEEHGYPASETEDSSDNGSMSGSSSCRSNLHDEVLMQPYLLPNVITTQMHSMLCIGYTYKRRADPFKSYTRSSK